MSTLSQVSRYFRELILLKNQTLFNTNMNTDRFVKALQGVDLDVLGGVGDLYEIILSIDFHQLTIDDFTKWFFNDETRLLNIIGLWSLDFIKSPKYVDSMLVGYDEKLLDTRQETLIVRGLITVLKTCRIEDEHDGDAVDIQFDACGRLYRLRKSEAEHLLMKELQKSQRIQVKIRLIDALGVLVSHQNQGYLQESTVNYIKGIAVESNDIALRYYAKSMLLRDVARVNEESPFLQKPLDLSG